MTNVRIIPVLLLKNEGLVKTVNFSKPKYVGDPINAVRIFNEKEVDELVFLDITATLEKRDPNFKMLEEIASECFMPLSYGGGVNNLSQVQKLFSIGIEKIIFNSVIYSNPSLITEVSNIFGNQSVVASIDVKKSFFGKYEVYSNAGTTKVNESLSSIISKIQSLGVGELIINSIDSDGTLKGYDLDLIKLISQSLNIPVVALGGASSLSDFKLAIQAGASAVAAGSFFIFHGKHKAVLISYPNLSEINNLF
jgi:cyclase